MTRRSRRGKPFGGPWYSDSRVLAQFEHGLRHQYEVVHRDYLRKGRNAGLRYRAGLDVSDDYEPRKVAMCFPRELITPRVFVDGPDESPHRYRDGSLCIWYGDDPEERRWVLKDGLVSLLSLCQEHLFSEAYWRETDEWPKPEAPHPPGRSAKPMIVTRRYRRARWS